MISVVIKGPTFLEANQQISKALLFADLVELRLDGFTLLDFDALKTLRAHFSIPMIFTLRCQSQGGGYLKSEDHRIADMRRLIDLKPEYLDIESSVSPRFIAEIPSDIKLILSYHNFKETPEDLEGIYQKMQKTPAHFYKMAVKAQNCLDAMRLISFAKKSDDQLIAISMGSHGQISRILGPIIGCPITYAGEEESVLGQLTADTLIEKYHYRSLNSKTILLGLIGDPVTQSISDETHNSLIRAAKLDAVYVKMQVSSAELPAFLQYAKQLPFHGLSVTMPLKEQIFSEAINTLLFKNGKILGSNTDGMGALNVIEKLCQVRGKRIVIIGAGGAAKAIAFEAIQRGGHVTIINRDEEKARQIAKSLHCTGQGLEYMATCFDTGYDVLINCTPIALPIAADYILPQTIVMDITTKPKDTAFLIEAIKKGCQVIYGYQMFVEQALGQFDLWFNSFDIQKNRQILEKKAIEIVQSFVKH